MTPCAVCGLPGEPLKGVRADFSDGDLRWVTAPSPGNACSPECATLVFVRPWDMTHDEQRLTAWRWRQRRAEARGEVFNEAPPMDEEERKWVVLNSMLRGRAA